VNGQRVERDDIRRLQQAVRGTKHDQPQDLHAPMSLIHGTTPSQSRLSARKQSPHHSLRQDLEVCVRPVVLTLLPTSPAAVMSQQEIRWWMTELRRR